MATTGQAFAITCAIYLGVCLGVLILFDIWRRIPVFRKFYAPKRHTRGAQRKPRRLPKRLGRWILGVLRQREGEVIATAGVDAAMYLKVLRCGLELFFALGLLTCAVILPINCTGGEVAALLQQEGAGWLSGNFMYWVPPREVAVQEEGGGVGLVVEPAKPRVVKPPDFYEDNLPPPPPGLEWWEYKPDVPLLPEPKDVLGPGYARYGWRYDATYQDVQYRFSDLDKSTMANIPSGSPRLYAHAVITWVATCFTLWHLWRYNKEAVRLRMWHLLHAPPGAESHTVLLTDIPGIFYGTLPHRVDSTLLRFLPQRLKRALVRKAAEGLGSATKAFQQTIGTAVKTKAVQDSRASKLPPPEESQYFDAIPAEPSSRPSFAQRGSRQPPCNGGFGDGSCGGGSGPLQDVAGSTAAAAAGAVQGRGGPPTASAPDPWAAMAAQLQAGRGVEEMVEAELRALYGDELAHVHLVRDTRRLDPLFAEYGVTLRALCDLADQYAAQRRRRRRVKPKLVVVLGVKYWRWGLERYGPKPEKVDRLQFLRDRLEELRRAVGEEKARALGMAVPAAFATFKTRQAQVVAADALICRDSNYWRCEAAPGAQEVEWRNLGWRMWERGVRRGAAWAAFMLLALFFMVPVTAVQGLLAINSLTEWLSHYPFFNAILTAILPGLALRVFLLLLPLIIATLNLYSGMTSKSEIDLGVVTRYYIFQVITVFFWSFIAGSFANQLKQFVNTPSSILTVLGTAAPQTAIFFMTYLLLQALLSKPLSLLRLIDLIKFWVASCLAATQRARERLWQEQNVRYGTLIPDDTIALLLGLVFCLICPLITIVALTYYAVTLFVWKYQLLYVYRAEYESGGKVWNRVFNQICFALFMFQLIMVGILGIKRSVGAPLIVLPLLFITPFYWWACREIFLRPQEALALADAAALDAQDKEQGLSAEGGEGPGAEAVAHYYLSPSFNLDEAEFLAALQEADALLAWLAAGQQEAQDIEACLVLGESADFQSAADEQLASNTASTAAATAGPRSCIVNELFQAEDSPREALTRRSSSGSGGGGSGSSSGPGLAGLDAEDVMPRRSSVPGTGAGSEVGRDSSAGDDDDRQPRRHLFQRMFNRAGM